MILMEKTEEYRSLKKGACVSMFCCIYQEELQENDWYCSITPRRALKIVLQYAGAEMFHPMQKRCVALAFSEIAKLTVTEAGWRLLAPQLATLIEQAIFPALRFKEQDRLDWEDDEDNFLKKYLSMTLDPVADDDMTPRQSAQSLLGLIAMGKVQGQTGSRKCKDFDQGGNVGDTLIFPSLLNVALPENFSPPTSEGASKYFGTLIAYGGLRQFLKMQTPEFVAMLICTRVIPLFYMETASPHIVAAACWLIGTLATCMPKKLSKVIFDGLMKALLTPDHGNVKWHSVRATAARTIVILLQEMYIPENWLPLLHGAVTGARKLGVQGTLLCFQLLSAFIEAGGPSISQFVPSITSGVQQEIIKHFVPIDGRWSEVADEGFAVLASLVHVWDASEPQKTGENQAWQKWKAGSALISCSLSHTLEHAWLHAAEFNQLATAPVCLSDQTIVLAGVLKYTDSAKTLEILKVEALLQAWVKIITPWKAWEEKEDMVVFEVIDESLSLQARCPFIGLENFSPGSVILEGFSTFVSSCMESGCSGAASRACRRTHSLLHACVSSHESLKFVVSCVTNSAIRRLRQLKRSPGVPLVKSLLLVIATSFVLSPALVEQILTENMLSSKSSSHKSGFIRWGEGFNSLLESGRSPGLHKRTELKLAVITLLRLVTYLSTTEGRFGSSGTSLVSSCLLSMLEVITRMKELDVQFSEESEDFGGDSELDEEAWVGRSEEYLQYRRAQLSRELKKEVQWSSEDDHELELGLLNSSSDEGIIQTCLKKLGCYGLTGVADFAEKYPEYSNVLLTQAR